MLKKLLSIILSILVVATSLLSAIMLAVSADTLAAGVYPYATNGVKTPVITHKTDSDAVALNDFFAKITADSLTTDNYYNTFKPYGHALENEVVNNKTLIASSLDSYSDTADNVYGSSGKSYKASYISTTNSKVKPANFEEQQWFHYVRVTNTMILSADYKDTASVGFWVKSTHQAYIVVRLSANTSGTESFIVSDRILIPAGESFVEIPLSNFVTVYDGYNPLREASGDIRIYNTDIFFKSTETFTGNRDIWFDNIGFYNCSSNAGKALHSSDAIVKNSIENYLQDGTAVKKDNVTWNADSKGSITVSNPVSGTANSNAYNGNGQSICYTTKQASVSAYNRFRNNGSVNTQNAEGEPTGVNAKLAVWIKTNRAIKIFLTADDSTSANSGRNRYQSSEYFLPAGESILEIPVSDFNTQYVIGTQTVDNQFIWDYLGSINFYFKSAFDNGNADATVWVDNIAIIPGQIDDTPESSEESSSAESSSVESSSEEASSEESSSAESSSEESSSIESSSEESSSDTSSETPVVPSTKISHDEGFVEVTLNPNNWVNKKTETSSFILDNNAAYSHKSDNNAYKLTYSNISETDNLINFYYNSRIYINGTAPYIFEEDSVFSFWVRADQPMVLTLTYMDHDNVTNGQAQTGTKVINIPAGESIVRLNMSEMIKTGCEFDYRYLFQFQIRVNSTADSYKTSGEIYFDAFGFYDADPTNNIPEQPEPPTIPDTKVTHTSDFVESTLKADKWVNKKPETSSFALDTDAAYSHGSDKNAYKLTYSNLSATESFVNFYYDEKLYINGIAPYIYDEDSVFSFWVRADQPITLRVTYMDYDSISGKYSQAITKPIDISAGESLVKIDMKEMGYDTVSFDYRYVYQLQIHVRANDQSYKTSGEIYFDAFGFYDKDPSNDIPKQPEPPKVPDTKVTHTSDFFEATLKEDMWVNKKPETSHFSLDSNAAYSHGSDKNAYKLTYSNLSSTENLINFYYNTHIKLNGIAPYIYDEDSVFSFWVRADQPMSIYVTYMDYDNNSGKMAQAGWKEIDVPAGESIVKIDMKDMARGDVSFDYRYLFQLQIQVKANAQSYKTSGEIYFDAFGFYDADPSNDIPKQPEPPVIPDTKVTHTKDFYEVTFNNDKWVNKKPETSAFELDTNAAYSHGSDKSAYKVSYSNISTTDNYVNFYYDEKLYINSVAPYIYDEDSVLSFWVRADQPLTLRVTYMDHDNISGKYSQAITKTVNVPAGESIVKIDMKDMGYDAVSFDYRYVYQLQIQVRANEESFKTSGDVYFDAFGFYDKDPANEIPKKPETPKIPDTKVTHDIGFVEIEPDPEMWLTKKVDNVAISLVDSAIRYHSGKTNVASNSSALKITYKNLSPSTRNVSFYSESRIQLSNTEPYIYGESSILSFWVYTEQAVDLKVTYMDFSNTAGKSVQCVEKTVSIPIGESIVKIPMKDCIPADNEMGYRFAYQLQISVYANDDSYKSAGDIFFDAFGFYDSELVINDKPLSIPKNSFIWWNFDNGDTLEEIPDGWTTRWAGEDGKGIVATLEKDPANVYGGKGNSLKLSYVRALGEHTAPNIWIEKRMATMGDGLVFWIKSEEKTNIRIVCLDANVDAIETLVPVTIGYNVVTVKWSDFTYTDKTKTGTPATNSIAQLQLRPMGASGTFWLDQVGFTNVKNDGSNAYNSVYPPTSYKDWEEGQVSGGDGFDDWASDDDFDFCTAWYFQDTGWITLPKIGNNAVLKMDYDRSNGQRSELINITEYKEVDPNGGISFWAKSSEKRYYTLKISIGTQIIAVNFMGDTKGRTYNIPFSAFWINGRIDKDYIPTSSNGTTVTKLQFVSDETCNPPSTGALSDKFSLYLDDIKFIDSPSFMRASDVDYTENGVTLKADLNAFKVGIIPKITKTELSDSEKQEYLKLATDANGIIALYNIVATDKDGKVQIPSAAVELIFDLPSGVDAASAQIYQVYLDGSLSKRPVTVTEDGRISTSVFRLGEYLLAWGEVKNQTSTDQTEPTDTPTAPTEQPNSFPWVVVIVIAAVILVGGTVAVIIFVRKGRGK